jgi:hypothetical protein
MQGLKKLPEKQESNSIYFRVAEFKSSRVIIYEKDMNLLFSAAILIPEGFPMNNSGCKPGVQAYNTIPNPVRV